MAARNILEGLKRGFMVVSVLVALYWLLIGYEKAEPPYQCFQKEERWWDEFPTVLPDGSLITPKPKPKFDRSVCPPSVEHAVAKQVGNGLWYGLIAVSGMLAIWLTFRWIFIGFFPSAISLKK